MKLTPAARTRTRAWPGPGAPGSCSPSARTSGPPVRETTIARPMRASVPASGRSARADGGRAGRAALLGAVGEVGAAAIVRVVDRGVAVVVDPVHAGGERGRRPSRVGPVGEAHVLAGLR